tara:strand:- start:46599 stop:46931 length:333 start_codon:yes stop_codon:yes gene_type:complete
MIVVIEGDGRIPYIVGDTEALIMIENYFTSLYGVSNHSVTGKWVVDLGNSPEDCCILDASDNQTEYLIYEPLSNFCELVGIDLYISGSRYRHDIINKYRELKENTDVTDN